MNLKIKEKRMKSKYLLCLLTFLLPSIFILNNNYNLIGFDGIIKLFLIPLILSSILLIINYIFSKKKDFY